MTESFMRRRLRTQAFAYYPQPMVRMLSTKHAITGLIFYFSMRRFRKSIVLKWQASLDAIPTLCHILFVLTTTESFPDDIQKRAEQAGFVCMVSKSAAPALVVDVVRRSLSATSKLSLPTAHGASRDNGPG